MDVKLGPELTLKNIEAALAEWDLVARGTMRIDLSACRSIDSVALLYVVAVTACRADANLVTRFLLPRDAEARHYIRQRDFASAIEEVAEVPFRLLVDGNWFVDKPSEPGYQAELTDADSAILAYLDERHFFSFSHYGIDSREDRAPLIEREGIRWRNPLVIELLRSRLRQRDAEEVSRVIIREMLANLLSQAASGDVMCISSVDEAGSEYAANSFLTIAAWYGPTAEARSAREIFDRLMVLIDLPEQRGHFSIHVSPSPLGPSTGPVHDESGEKPEPDEIVEDINWRQSEGLKSLYTHVVDKFDGHLDLCTDRTFAELSKNEGSEVRYQVDVRKRESSTSTGSIIAVRLPLRHV